MLQSWLSTTQNPNFKKHLKKPEIQQMVANVNNLFHYDLNLFLRPTFNKQINLAMDWCTQLQTFLLDVNFTSPVALIAALTPILQDCKQLLMVLEHYLQNNTMPTTFRDDYIHSLILPSGYCFVIPEEFKNHITPIGDEVRFYDNIYYYPSTAMTNPIADIPSEYFALNAAPTTHHYPKKSPAILLSVDSTRGHKTLFTAKLLNLLLKPRGVTLEALLLAHDLFHLVCSASLKKTSKIIINKLSDFIEHSPNHLHLYKQDLFHACLPSQYQAAPASQTTFQYLMDKNFQPKSVFSALTVLQVLEEPPSVDGLNNWFVSTIPYIDAFITVYDYYRHEYDNDEFRHLLKKAIENLNAHHIQLLGLSCHIFFAHDTLGKDFIVDLEIKPHALIYIGVNHSCKRRENTTPVLSNTEDDDESFHSATSFESEFAMTNSILTIFSPFQCMPLRPSVLANLKSTSAEKLIFLALNAAKSYETDYEYFYKRFPFTSNALYQIRNALQLSSAILFRSYQNISNVISAISAGEQIPNRILSKISATSAELSSLAFKALIDSSLMWRFNYFNQASLSASSSESPRERSGVSVKFIDFHLAADLLLIFLFQWVNYKTLKDDDHAELCRLIQMTLGDEGFLNELQILSLRQKNPRNLSSYSSGSAYEPHSPRGDTRERLSNSSRSSLANSTRLGVHSPLARLSLSAERTPINPLTPRAPHTTYETDNTSEFDRGHSTPSF